MTIEKVYLKEVPACAQFFAEATVGIYRFNGQVVRLVQEAGLYYRQFNGGVMEMISQKQFQQMWNHHRKICLFQTVYRCENTQVKIIRYHDCLEGLIVARGQKIPNEWPRAINLDFQRYAKQIPNFRELKDFLF